MYNPNNQYRCTIIRGKSQTQMEDLLPLYYNMVHKYCPCEESMFRQQARTELSMALFNNKSYDLLPESNQKTVDNHITEIAGTLLGLYYYKVENGRSFIYESQSCLHLVENHDFPVFFKNLCLNFQFPNGSKWINYTRTDISKNLNIRPFCYVIALLYYAQKQEEKFKLSKQEIGYYVLNNLDVLQGIVSPEEVYRQIMFDRKNKIKHDSLSGSRDWQHIKEQFNLLELANLVVFDATYIWLNDKEKDSISIFLNKGYKPGFDCYKYNLDVKEERENFIEDWKQYNGTLNSELNNIKTDFSSDIVIFGDDKLKANGSAIKSSVDLGDEGEAFVYKIEVERVKKYKERLVNKVLLLGKTKGLGYDISSIEADENNECPEFARYIEVKSTKRVTEPKFDGSWSDSLNLTSKEWIAARQYGDFYNIYRVYFTKSKVIVVRIQNPYLKAQNNEIEVFPTIYQMNFGSNVIELRYDK